MLDRSSDLHGLLEWTIVAFVRGRVRRTASECQGAAGRESIERLRRMRNIRLPQSNDMMHLSHASTPYQAGNSPQLRESNCKESARRTSDGGGMSPAESDNE